MDMHAHPSSLEQSGQAEHLITNNRSWIKKVTQDLSPESRILETSMQNFRNTGTTPFLELPTKRILPRLAKICRLPKDLRNTVINLIEYKHWQHYQYINTLHILVPSHHVQQKRLLDLKAPNWNEWAFTDGSLVTNKENQSIGAEVYHPQFINITTVGPGGTSINKPTNRAELAGVVSSCPESLVARGQARLFRVAGSNPPGSVSTSLSDSSVSISLILA
jgi:hypothetical protein